MAATPLASSYRKAPKSSQSTVVSTPLYLFFNSRSLIRRHGQGFCLGVLHSGLLSIQELHHGLEIPRDPSHP